MCGYKQNENSDEKRENVLNNVDDLVVIGKGDEQREKFNLCDSEPEQAGVNKGTTDCIVGVTLTP